MLPLSLSPLCRCRHSGTKIPSGIPHMPPPAAVARGNHQRRAQVAFSMKSILYEVVTWTWQKYFGSISLSLHTKKADQRAMSDSRVQREITLFQMTFEWKRGSRVMAVVPVSSFIDFCPEIQDGRAGCTTNSTKTKQIFGLRSRVKRGFPNRQTRMSSWNRRRTATNTGLLSELKIARSLWRA